MDPIARAEIAASRTLIVPLWRCGSKCLEGLPKRKKNSLSFVYRIEIVELEPEAVPERDSRGAGDGGDEGAWVEGREGAGGVLQQRGRLLGPQRDPVRADKPTGSHG